MPEHDAEVTAAFLTFSRAKLADYLERLRASVEPLTDEQVWWRPNDASNSIGNLLLHLSGNIRQWLIASFAGEQDQRDRPTEFAERRHLPPDVLIQQLDATVQRASAVLAQLSAADLTPTRNIQGYTVTGLEAVYHVVEHFSMHYGQIVYITKQLRNRDLGFYAELDRTGRREGGTSK